MVFASMLFFAFFVSIPFTHIFPSEGFKIPARSLLNVDFPAPFSPVSATNSPSSIESEIPCISSASFVFP